MTPGQLPPDDQALLLRLLATLGYAPAALPAARLRGIRNPDGSLRWIWPAGLHEPLFLAFYSATSPKARVFSWLVRLIFFLRIQRFFFPLLPGGFGPAAGEHQLGGGLFALFLGTPGPYRKAVCCFLDAAGDTLFAKLPLTPGAAHNVRAETTTLRLLAQQPSVSFEVPRVMAANPDWLVQTSVRRPGACRAACFGPAHAAFLREMQASATTQPLAQIAYWQTIERHVSQLRELPTTRIPSGLRAKLARLLLVIEPDQEVALAFAHGDFTPWNCWLTSRGLALYDLEFALPAAPLLHDLFHFHVQQGLLVDRLAPALVHARAQQAARTFFPELADADVTRSFRLYLLHQISSFALVYDAQARWHAQVNWLLQGWNALLTIELADTVSHRQLALYDLFDYLLLTTSAVVLKPRSINPYYPGPTSDLDLLLPASAARHARRFLQHLPLLRRARVQQHLHRTAVDCHFRDGSFLSVDLIRQLVRKDLRLIDADAVLKAATPTQSEVLVPSAVHDFAYTWLFYWLNDSAVPAAHLHHFLQLPEAIQAGLLRYLKATYSLSFATLTEAAVCTPASVARVRQVLRQTPGNGRLARALRGLRYLAGTAGRWWRPGGLVITFSGVDGAGKSTVIEHVKAHLEKQWRKRVVVVRHRPSVLPILSAWQYGKTRAEARSVEQLPRQGTNTSRLSSALRFAYYYLDYLFGQGVIWLRHTSRGHIVLYDRYYFDFIHDGRRSNIELPTTLTRGLYAFLAKPRLNFFLYAAPEEILRRKQELSLATITELTSRYLALFRQLGAGSRRARYVPIENHDLSATLGLIGDCIREELR